MKINPETSIPPIRPGRHDFHVVPAQGNWTVKAEHAAGYTGLFQTQLEATSFAVELARNSAAQVIIHGRDGRFREVWNYA